MAQNLVIPNKDNLVVFTFGGIDLTTATNLVINFGNEVYSLVDDPTLVSVTATDLSLNLSGTAEVGKIYATITFFDGASVNGTDITSRELGNSDKIVVAIGSQLIIEDGSVVVGANSFVTDTEFKAYADLRNIDIPATQPDRESLLAQAYDYLNCTYERLLQGSRVSAEQTGLFPRSNVYAHGFPIGSTAIPNDIKTAQLLIATSINEGANTTAVKTDADLASFEVVGVYKESYQSGSTTPTLPEMPAVTRCLYPYSNGAISGDGLTRENMGYLG